MKIYQPLIKEENRECETITICCTSAIATRNGSGPYLCVNSIKGLFKEYEEIILRNLPDGINYDPNFKCEVKNCPYNK